MNKIEGHLKICNEAASRRSIDAGNLPDASHTTAQKSPFARNRREVLLQAPVASYWEAPIAKSRRAKPASVKSLPHSSAATKGARAKHRKVNATQAADIEKWRNMSEAERLPYEEMAMKYRKFRKKSSSFHMFMREQKSIRNTVEQCLVEMVNTVTGDSHRDDTSGGMVNYAKESVSTFSSTTHSIARDATAPIEENPGGGHHSGGTGCVIGVRGKYQAGIIRAIIELKEWARGSSFAKIRQHMQSAGIGSSTKWSNHAFLGAVKKMVADGDLVQVSTQKYKLSPSYKAKLKEANGKYKAGILRAIFELKDGALGSSLTRIKQQMHGGLKWENDIFIGAVKKMVADGDLVQVSAQMYKLSPSCEAELKETKMISHPLHLPYTAKVALDAWFQDHLENPYPTNEEKETLMEETGLSKKQIEGWLHKARKNNESITVLKGRIPDEAKATLNLWFENHLENPYPTEEEKGGFVEQTGLRKSQIESWFTIARNGKGIRKRRVYRMRRR